jgi:O-antigen/teichoic acid export membrane protein
MSNTKTIAKNSGWSGLDLIISAVIALFTSIAINRYLGPLKNGYIIYVSYIALLVSSLGGLGIPSNYAKIYGRVYRHGRPWHSAIHLSAHLAVADRSWRRWPPAVFSYGF